MADDAARLDVQSGRVTVILPGYLHTWVEQKAAENTISVSGYIRMQLANIRLLEVRRP